MSLERNYLDKFPAKAILYRVFCIVIWKIYSQGEIIMDIRARLEGIRQEDNRILRWNLYLTPVTKPGTFARSNRL